MHDTINGAMFKEMLLFGTVSIAQAQQAINDFNIIKISIYMWMYYQIIR